MAVASRILTDSLRPKIGKFQQPPRVPGMYSYTQIAQYLRCPRSYRYRYLDGWQEKDTRATLLFGRCFEKAIAAFFLGEDSTAALFKEWSVYRQSSTEYRSGEDWERVYRQGI